VNHRTWRREHGFQDRGMTDDELWKQISKKLEESL